jgi:hypothetical protein
LSDRVVQTFAILVVMALVVVLYLRSSLTTLRGQAPLILMRWQAIAALCEPRGMLPNSANLTTYLPMANPSQGPSFGNVFASADGGLWAADLWRRDDKIVEAFSMLVFTVSGVNLPYVAVARKGQIGIPSTAQGKPVELESIDFNDRFAIRAEDGRSALMLLDLGMMQWLLDCDLVSFEMAGDKVQALVKRSAEPASQASLPTPTYPQRAEPVELDLLFRFCDGFLSRVPQLLRTEYSATTT